MIEISRKTKEFRKIRDLIKNTKELSEMHEKICIFYSIKDYSYVKLKEIPLQHADYLNAYKQILNFFKDSDKRMFYDYVHQVFCFKSYRVSVVAEYPFTVAKESGKLKSDKTSQKKDLNSIK